MSVWTFCLVACGCTGLWLAPRRWWGWGITSLSELLWVAYAASTHDRPLFIMAWIWLALNLRGCYVARKAHLLAVREIVPGDARPDQGPLGRIAVRRMQGEILPDQ